MISKLSLQLTSFICTEAYDNEKDRARIQYGLSVLLSEGFKLITLILFFNIIHKQNLFYFSLLILMSIRVFAGGVHVKGSLNCLLLTALMFIFTCVLAPIIPELSKVYYLFLGLTSLIVILAIAPICSVRRPIKDNKIKLKYKLTAAAATALWVITLMFFKSKVYINCGFATILAQNLQLVMVYKEKY